MKYILLLHIIIFSNLFSLAENSNSFEIANEYYTKKKYEEAKRKYIKLLSEEKENASIYYNLGNCYFHQKEYLYAILYYEKALKISPNNTSIAHNLRLANEKGLKKNMYSSNFFLLQWFQNFYFKYSSTHWSILFLFCFWLFGVLSFIYFRSRKALVFNLSLIAFLLSILLFFLAKQKYDYENHPTHAIVLDDTFYLSKPSQTAKILGNIEKGNKVKLLDNDGSYYKIKLINNKKVWIKKEKIATY